VKEHNKTAAEILRDAAIHLTLRYGTRSAMVIAREDYNDYIAIKLLEALEGLALFDPKKIVQSN
jgi:hypothetical protein